MEEKKQTRRAYPSPEEPVPGNCSWMQGKYLYFTSALSAQTAHWSLLHWAAAWRSWAILGWFDETGHGKAQPAPRRATEVTSSEPTSAPFPGVVPLLPGSEHLLRPTPCPRGAKSPCLILIVIDLAAHSFSTRVLYLGLTNSKKSSCLSLSEPQPWRLRHWEWSTFINGLWKWAERQSVLPTMCNSSG